MGACLCNKKESVVPKDDCSSPISTRFSYVQKGNIQRSYAFKGVLGVGYFGCVRVAVRQNSSSKTKFAVKSIRKAKVSDYTSLVNELEVLHQADHPNIIRLYDIYEDDLYIHLVTELCQGGELYTRLLERKRFGEREAANLIYKVLHAVNYLHSLKISHRDIKAENLLISDNEVKLADFGLSKKFAEAGEMESLVGTPYYVAPEVLHKKYGPECDVWSIGVLTYFLLCGQPPFLAESRKDLYVQILEGAYSFSDSLWSSVSDEAKHLIQRMLCSSRDERITACEAMEHPWFVVHVSTKKPDPRILRRIARFKRSQTLREDVISVISRHLKAGEIARLNELFRVADTQHTGCVSLQELKTILHSLGTLDEGGVTELARIAGCSETVNYSEFITVAMDRRILLDLNTRWMAFKFFDTEDRGYITVESIQSALEKIGETKSEAAIRRMIQEAGLKYDKWLDFEEFCGLLEPLPGELSSSSNSLHDIDPSFLRQSSLDLFTL